MFTLIASEGILFAIPLFCVATMFAMGLDLTRKDLSAPTRNLLAVAIIILVNNIFVPLLGFAIVVLPILFKDGILEGLTKQIVPLVDGQRAGFLLVLLASGTILGPTLTRFSGGNSHFAKGTMAVLVVASALLIPFELELLSMFPGILGGISLQSGAVFWQLLLLGIIPLALGIVIKVRYDPVAILLRPYITQLAGLIFLLLLALVVISGQATLGATEQAPPLLVDSFTVSDVVSIDELEQNVSYSEDPADIESLHSLFFDAGIPYPDVAEVRQLTQGIEALPKLDAWVVLDLENTYVISYTNDIPEALTISGAQLSGELDLEDADFDNDGVSARVNELNNGLIDEKLIAAIEKKGESIDGEGKITVLVDTVIPLETGEEWLTLLAHQSYLITLDKGDLTVYQIMVQPLGVVSELLTAVQSLPDTGPIMDVLQQLLAIAIPYAMLAAVAALVMIIGFYGGVALRNLFGLTGNEMPRSLATSTTVRNLSFALILAIQVPGSGVISMVLIFYVVSLIVATHMAIRWGKEKEADTDEGDDDIIGDLTEAVEEIGALAGDAAPIEEPT